MPGEVRDREGDDPEEKSEAEPEDLASGVVRCES